MGCDIHASVEWRRHDGITQGSREWWVHILDCGFLPRNYAIFSCLVDGHSRDYDEIGGVAPERGLPPAPSDVASDVGYYHEHHDGSIAPAVAYADHTFSWLTAEEYGAALKRYSDRYPQEAIDPEWLALGAYLDAMAKAGPVRLVFGFDN